jgi:hypothetical protein
MFAYLEEVDRFCNRKERTIAEPQSQLCVFDCDAERKSTTKILVHDIVKAPDYLLFVLEQAL